jgi:hypothetical protein
MQRAWLPVSSFVLATLLCACPRDPGASEPVRTDPTKIAPPPSSSPSSSGSSVASAGSRRRHRTRPLAPHGPPLPSSTPVGAGELTKAGGAGGEFIIIAPDDTCFYKTLANAPTNAPVDPWRTVVIDCPPEYDDPAWDECVLGRMSGVRGGAHCECMNDGATVKWGTACPK